MDTPSDSGKRGRGRRSDARPAGDSAPDPSAILTTLTARLDHLERTTAMFDRRLRAIETRLQIAAPAPSIAAPTPPVAPPAAVVSRPEPSPVGSGAGTAWTAVQTLLDGKPSSRRVDQPPIAPQPTRPPAVPAPPVRARTRPSVSLDDLERAVSGRGLAWAGGLTLLVGALFFFSLAISRGWIGPEARVVIGIVAGLVVTGLGDRLMRGGDRILGPVLVAVGIGVWNLALVAGTRLYDFVPDWAALLGAAAGAVVATSIAIRANAQIIALYGMMTALAAPMLFAVPSARLSMAYLIIVLLGSTTISIARGWAWLPPVAFVLSEVQFWGWWRTTEAPEWTILLAISILSLLHLIAATGADLRAKTPAAQLIALALLLVNALAFATVSFGTLFDERLRLGLYLLGGVAVHAAAATVVRQRKGQASAFTYGAFGIAVILFTTAIPVVFDGPAVAIAWAAEAVGLVWLALRFQSAAAFGAGTMVYALAVAHLFSIEYDALSGPAPEAAQGTPFVNEAGLTLLALLVALAAAGAIMRARLPRMIFAVVGFGLLIAALPYELSGLSLITGWSLLAVLALACERFFALPSGEIPLDSNPNRAWFAMNGLRIPAAVAAGFAIYHAVVYQMPVPSLAQIGAGTFSDQPVLAAVIIIGAALAAAAVTKADEVRQIAVAVAILIAANLAAYLLDPALAVAAWSILAVAAALLQQRVPGPLRVLLLSSGILLVLGVGVTLAGIALPSRLLVAAEATIDHPFLWSEATLALGALAAAFFVIARLVRETPASVWLALGSGVLAVYLLSIGIVDEFQGRVDGAASVAELRRQSQVALSVVWAVLGGVAVAAGLVRAIASLRWFGLGLLAMTMGKVFLYDLASLDAVYRVLSFIVLGILLLLSSYAYRRLGATTDDNHQSPAGITPAGTVGVPSEPG